jgi:hypothetical protein
VVLFLQIYTLQIAEVMEVNDYIKMDPNMLQRLLKDHMNNVNKLREQLAGEKALDIKVLGLKRLPNPYLHSIWNKFSDYLALVLGILLFIFLMSAAFKATSKKKSSPARKKTFQKQKKPSIWQRFTDWTSHAVSPVSSTIGRLNPFRGDPPTIARPPYGAGRCDNIEWRDMGGEGNPGLCVRSYATPTTVWTLDPDTMPELNELPGPMSETIRGKDNSKMQIHIPWKTQSTFYVPQCKDAYFLEKDTNGNLIQQSAAHLLEEQGLSCKLREVLSTTYDENKYRPKNSVQKDAWATTNDPKC